MKPTVLPIALSAVGMLGLALQAQGAVTTQVIGNMSPIQHTCLQGLVNQVGDGENCMYGGGPAADASFAPVGDEITGPYEQIRYYDSLATPEAFQSTTLPNGARVLYVPTPGDGKISQVITGSVTIDDNGNGFGADDLISFTLTFTSPGGGSIIRSYGSAIVEKYDSMTQVLNPRTAHSVTGNSFGGFDYVIGSAGFPELLVFNPNFVTVIPGEEEGDPPTIILDPVASDCQGQPFGWVECAHSFSAGPDPDFWYGSNPGAGLGLLEGNLGAKTIGTVTGLDCIDNATVSATTGAVIESNDCRDSQVGYSPYLGVKGTCLVAGGCVVGGARGASEDVGWDNLLLKISTDEAGNVISMAGFNVDDYRVFGQTRCGDNTTGDGSTGTYIAVCNSWTSGYFTVAAVPAPPAVWLMLTGVLGLVGRQLRRRAA